MLIFSTKCFNFTIFFCIFTILSIFPVIFQFSIIFIFVINLHKLNFYCKFTSTTKILKIKTVKTLIKALTSEVKSGSKNRFAKHYSGIFCWQNAIIIFFIFFFHNCIMWFLSMFFFWYFFWVNEKLNKNEIKIEIKMKMSWKCCKKLWSVLTRNKKWFL